MPERRVFRANPIARVEYSDWGKGSPNKRYRFYYDSRTGRRVSKVHAKRYPKYAKQSYAYTSRLTGRQVPKKAVLKKTGPEAWYKQGILESTADKKFKSKSTQEKWAQNVFKRLKEYRQMHLKPQGSPDLGRYLQYLKEKRGEFYQSLIDADLAPENPEKAYKPLQTLDMKR